MQTIIERVRSVLKPYKAYVGELTHEKEKIYKAAIEFPQAINERLPYIIRRIQMALATRIKCADVILVSKRYGHEIRIRFK